MQKQNLPGSYSGLFLEKYQQPPVLRADLKLPQLQEKDILIKVKFSPINPCDQLQQSGLFANDQSVPPNYTPGMEGSGVIVAAKGKYEETLIGKRVGFLPKEGSGTGSYGQYVISTRQQIVVLPEDVSLQTGACSLINPLTIVSMFKVIQERNVKAIVHTAAASQLGKMMIKYFQANGVKVIGVVRKDSQVETLKKCGITAVFNQNSPDFEQKLKECAALHKVSAGFDAIQGEMTWKILRNLPPRSNIYIYGLLDGNFTLNNVDAIQFINNNKSISGFSTFSYIATSTEEEVQELISKIGPSLNTHFKTEISKEINIKDYANGVENYFKNMGEGKILVKQN